MTTDSDWRQHLALGIGKVRLVNDEGNVQTAQVQLSASETRDGTPMVQNFGFQSSAPDGSEAIFASLDAQRSKVAVIGTNHQASRYKGLARGGAVHHDQGGSFVLLNNDGVILLVPSGGTVRIAGNVVITGTLEVDGAATVKGEVTAKSGTSASVSLSGHRGHTAGGSAPPTPGT